jgi:8-oxo-dGTP diphosphatase
MTHCRTPFEAAFGGYARVRFMEEQTMVPDKPHKLVTVVCACIKSPGGREVLLSMRSAPGIAGLDGKWELPGGKIEFGETPDKAIVREIQEELGIKIVPRRLLPYLHTNIWEYPHVCTHVVLAGFECELVGSELPSLGRDARWCDPADIDFDMTLPGTQEFISLAMKDERFDGICIRFQTEYSPKQSSKQFTVTTQPTLFSEYGLVKYWGRIGDRLRMRIEEFDSPRKLDSEILETAKRRLSDGYHITAVQGSERSFKPLMHIIEIAKARNQFSPD